MDSAKTAGQGARKIGLEEIRKYVIHDAVRIE
jgi:hypothetical protein